MVSAGKGTQAESEGSPERGVAGCFRGWEGFLEGTLQLGLKEDKEEKVERRASEAAAELRLGRCGQWTLIAADISSALSLCWALV